MNKLAVIDKSKVKGFTLVELIAVLLILSVIGAMGVGFVTTNMQVMVSVRNQQHLFKDGQFVLRRIDGEITNALPNSLRISNNGQCLEFLPVVASGVYLADVPDGLNGDPATGRSTAITVAPFTPYGEASVSFMAIGALNSAEVYGANPASLSAVRRYTNTSVQLEADKTWLNNSVSHRFYLLGLARAFCFINGDIRFYRDLSPASGSVNLSSDYDLLSTQLAPGEFRLQLLNASAVQNAGIQLEIMLRRGQEQFPALRTVVIKHVP